MSPAIGGASGSSAGEDAGSLVGSSCPDITSIDAANDAFDRTGSPGTRTSSLHRGQFAFVPARAEPTLNFWPQCLQRKRMGMSAGIDFARGSKQRRNG
jgi:hypothetical protein